MRTFPSPKIHDALDYIMSYYPDKYTEQAKTEVEMLLDHCLDDLGNDSEKFLSTLIIKALRHLIGPSEIDEHIYLKQYEITQIELFNILIKEFPFVKWGHELANNLISNKLKKSEKAVIIDIGIGQGIQVKNLLYKLEKENNLKEVVIIGVEPFKEALDTASKIIAEVQEDVSFSIKFEPLNIFVEQLNSTELKELISKYDGEIYINACLALHHILTLKDRIKVLKALRSIRPNGIVLIEPNSDHFEPEFVRRFQNCYQHFYHIFQVIDELPSDSKQKNGLKLFFGREIEDILGKSNEERYEKHEPAFRWIEKLISCKFNIKNNFLDSLPNVGGGIKLEFFEQGFLGFNYKTETVLSIIYAEPR